MIAVTAKYTSRPTTTSSAAARAIEISDSRNFCKSSMIISLYGIFPMFARCTKYAVASIAHRVINAGSNRLDPRNCWRGLRRRGMG
jgi:hypothetical protein